MKKYTLTIIYNDNTEELESLKETIDIERDTPISINASPKVMQKIDDARLIE